MKRDFRKGQSILEYTLLLGAIIAVVIAVLLSNGGMKSKVEDTYGAFGNAVSKTSDDIQTTGVFK